MFLQSSKQLVSHKGFTNMHFFDSPSESSSRPAVRSVHVDQNSKQGALMFSCLVQQIPSFLCELHVFYTTKTESRQLQRFSDRPQNHEVCHIALGLFHHHAVVFPCTNDGRQHSTSIHDHLDRFFHLDRSGRPPPHTSPDTT